MLCKYQISMFFVTFQINVKISILRCLKTQYGYISVNNQLARTMIRSLKDCFYDSECSRVGWEVFCFSQILLHSATADKFGQNNQI